MIFFFFFFFFFLWDSEILDQTALGLHSLNMPEDTLSHGAAHIK